MSSNTQSTSENEIIPDRKSLGLQAGPVNKIATLPAKLFAATLAELQAAARVKNCAAEARANRKLLSQVDLNVRQHGWDPLVGIRLLSEFAQGANQLMDGEKLLNNYADACLAKTTKFSNQSEKWVSGLSLEHDAIKSFLAADADQRKRHPPPSDSAFRYKLSLPIAKNQPPHSDFTVVPPKLFRSSSAGGNRAAAATAASSAGTTAVPPSAAVPQLRKTNSNPRPMFVPPAADLRPNHISPQWPPASTKATAFESTVISSGVSGPRCLTAAAAPGTSNSSRFSGRRMPPQAPAVSGDAARLIAAAGGSRAQIPVYPQQSSGPPSGAAPVSAFRTAHEQLLIDRQQKNNGRQQPQGAEITQSSYGGAKRCLGTRPGPAAGFKPPVRQQEPPAQLAPSAGYSGNYHDAPGDSSAEPPLDERYKNIDPKMIELITNEIMDQGAPVAWDDIAGLEFAKATVKEIVVWPMLRPDIFSGLRGPPKGLLLFGPPGTGKTLIGKCIACQSNSTFFAISASSLTSKWVGEGEKMVRALFAVAKVHQPSVVFIDEIDSLLSSRSDSEHEASRRIKTEFLVQLDGASTVGDERVLVVGATNRPQELDEAARRRLVKRLYIPLPEHAARRQIIRNLLMKERHQLSEEHIEEICHLTEGYSGADMANLCKEAAMGPIRSLDFSQIETVSAEQVRPIIFDDLKAALRQVKASVSSQDLDLYLDWNEKFGAGK